MFRQITYCTIAITASAFTSFGQKSLVKPVKASILYCDSSTLNSYRAELAKDKNRWDTTFIRKFFSIIHKFNGKPLDTAITTTGKLDEKGRLCKIRTRVYYYDSTVFVESRLTMNHKLLWKNSFKDPAPLFTVDAPKLFDWQTKNPWVHFTDGVFYRPPEFVDYKSTGTQILEEFPPDGKMIIDNDLSDSKNKGINITEKQFRAYLKNFKGDLFVYGDFVKKEQLYMWYTPAKCFILFYSP